MWLQVSLCKGIPLQRDTWNHICISHLLKNNNHQELPTILKTTGFIPEQLRITVLCKWSYLFLSIPHVSELHQLHAQAAHFLLHTIFRQLVRKEDKTTKCNSFVRIAVHTTLSKCSPPTLWLDRRAQDPKPDMLYIKTPADQQVKLPLAQEAQ